MERIIQETIDRYPSLKDLEGQIWKAYCMISDAYKKDKKLLVAGNGGSAADAEHIVGELMKGCNLPRIIDEELKNKLRKVDSKIGEELSEGLQGSLPAICLSGHGSLSTAIANDINGNFLFAQQLNGYGREGDIFLAISTSGNSYNILKTAVLARAKGMKVIALTGKTGGKLKEYSDLVINVPEEETYKVQELHLPIYHCLCMMLEEDFFGNHNGKEFYE